MATLICFIVYIILLALVISFLEIFNWLEDRKKTEEDKQREALLEAFLELTRRDRRK